MAYYERKDSRIQEQEIPFTSDDERSAHRELRQLLSPTYDEVTDYTLFRFLRFNSFNPQKAAAAFENYVQWRKANNIDKILDSPVPKIELIRKIVPYAYHGYDNEDRPIYFERTGHMVCSAIRDQVVTTEEFKQSHIWGLENLATLAYKRSLETGKRIESFATVIDMDGLWWHHKDAIPLLTACTVIDNAYFPERIGKLYIINLPWIAPALYQLVQPLVDPVTKTRIHPIHSDPKQYLPTVIPKQYLPVEYGGDCKCEQNGQHGCIPEYDSSDIAQAAKQSRPDGYQLEKVSYEFEKVVESGPEGGVFTYWFESEGGYDIDFSITDVTDDSNSSEPRYIKEPSRCVTSRGSWESKKAVKLLFRWDNNFSYFYSKDIAYLIAVSASTDFNFASGINNPKDQSAADIAKQQKA